jgi:hypothetical protein
MSGRVIELYSQRRTYLDTPGSDRAGKFRRQIQFIQGRNTEALTTVVSGQYFESAEKQLY